MQITAFPGSEFGANQQRGSNAMSAPTLGELGSTPRSHRNLPPPLLSHSDRLFTTHLGHSVPSMRKTARGRIAIIAPTSVDAPHDPNVPPSGLHASWFAQAQARSCGSATSVEARSDGRVLDRRDQGQVRFALPRMRGSINYPRLSASLKIALWSTNAIPLPCSGAGHARRGRFFLSET